MDKEERDFFNVQKGIKYEKAGKDEKAIKVYEKLIAENFDGSHVFFTENKKILPPKNTY